MRRERSLTPLLWAVILVVLTIIVALTLVSMIEGWVIWGEKRSRYIIVLGDSRIVRWSNGSYTIYLHMINTGNPESFLGEASLYGRYSISLSGSTICIVKGKVLVTGNSIYIAPGAELYIIIPLGQTNLIPRATYMAQIQLYTADNKIYEILLKISDSPPAGLNLCKRFIRVP